MKVETLFKIRTITAFIQLRSSDFKTKINTTPTEKNNNNKLEYKINQCGSFLSNAKQAFESNGYEVQTVRIATNPFGEWLLSDNNNNREEVEDKLQLLDKALEHNDIQFCSLGPSLDNEHTVKYCPMIVKSSPKYSCSASINDPCDVERADCIVKCIDSIANEDSLGNFRFCAAACCKPFIPFFPGAKCCSIADDVSDDEDDFTIRFGIGLENGRLVHKLLSEAGTLQNLPRVFKEGMLEALLPLQQICNGIEEVDNDSYSNTKYLGIDTSINPSLEDKGSIASAIEQLDNIPTFGDSGTLAAVSAITSILQSLPTIKLIGYCGVMLPLCEDTRLASLACSSQISIHQLLMISSVCGVGIDTVPIANLASNRNKLSALILDVVGIASKWDKSLSCRVFPLPGSDVGDTTQFDSPYLCNTRVLSI